MTAQPTGHVPWSPDPPGTRRRDTFEKPGDYAAAGIPHFWLPIADITP